MSIYCYECMTPNLPDGIRNCPSCGARIPYEAQNLRDCPPGTVLNGRYLLGKAIGHGGFGVTYIALDLKTGEKVCVKEYNPKSFSHRKPSNMEILLPDEGDEAYENYHKYKHGLLDEAKRLMELRSVQGVVRCYESFECNNTAYVVLEYLEGCDLKQYVLRKGGARNPPGVVEGVQLTCEVLRILSQVHKHKLLHRDISPDNIFLTDGALKLIDFGSSRKTYVEEMTGFNKIGYAAPEMVTGGKEGPYTDLYSVGGVLYFLLMGEKPSNISGTDRLCPPSPARSTHELTIVYNRATDPQPEARYQSAEVMMQDLMYCLQQFDGAALPSNQTGKRSGSLMRGLLIGTLSVTTAGLIGLIVMAGMKDEKEPQITANSNLVPATTYALPTPTPVSIVTDTPVSVETSTPTPILTPTPAPTPTLEMLQGPKASYLMLNGTSQDVTFGFSDGKQHDVNMHIVSGDSVLLDDTVLKAVHAGKSVIEYTVFGQKRTFTVDVLEMPKLSEEKKNTDGSYAESRFGVENSYDVNVPQGDELILSLPEISGVTYSLYCAKGDGQLVQLHDNKLTIKGNTQTQELYTISINGVDANLQPEIQLQVSISGHVVVSAHDDRYTILKGEALHLPVKLSDGASIDVKNDITNSGSLDVKVDPEDPMALIFSCNTPGEYNVNICGTTLYFSVLSEPRLTQIEQLKATNEGYSICIPEGCEISLQVEGVEREQMLGFVGGNDAAQLSFDRDNNLLVIRAGKKLGTGTWAVTYVGKQLFALEITVVSANTVTDLKDRYTIFTDSNPMTFVLDYQHEFDANVTVMVSPKDIVKAELDKGGRSLTITPLKCGKAEVKVAGQSFDFWVAKDDLTLFSKAGHKLERDGDEYRMEILDTELIMLNINGTHSEYALVCNELGGKINGDVVSIGGIPSGERRVYSFRSEGTDDDHELFRLVVNSSFDMQLETKLDGCDYVILENGEVRIPLVFRDDEVFALNVKCDERILAVTQQGKELVLTGLAAGQATVHVEDQSFTVNVAPANVCLETAGSDRIEKTDGNAYIVRVTRGQTLAIPLENVSPLYQLDCGTHDEDCGVVIVDGKLLISSNVSARGYSNHEIMATGTAGGDRRLFSVIVETVEPTPTPAPATPTPTPAPVYCLVQGPADIYHVFPDQRVEIPLTFGEDGHYALDLHGYDNSVVSMSHDKTNMYIDALAVGETDVSYVSGGRKHSFTVKVLESPQMELETGTAYRYMNKTHAGYALSLPAGDEAVLLIKGADNVSLQAVHVQGSANAAVTLDGDRLNVETKGKGTEVYSIRPAGSDLELFRVQINVDNRVLTNTPEKEYVLMVGGEVGVRLTFSDNGPVDLTEIGFDDDLLRVSRDDRDPNCLIIKALRSTDGVNVSVCGEYFVIKALEVPAVKTDDVVRSVGGDYHVALPVDGVYTMSLQNSDQRHDYTFKPVGNTVGSIRISEDGKSLTVTGGSVIGTGRWEVYDLGVFAFGLQIDVVSTEVTNELMDRTLYVGDTIIVKLEYAHNVNARPNVKVGDADAVKTDVSSDGRWMTVEALKESDTTVTVDGKSFRVTILDTNIGIRQTSGLTVRPDAMANYVLTMKDNDEPKVLDLTGVSANHNLSVRTNGQCAAVTLKNGRLHVDPTEAGIDICEIVNTVEGKERVLLTLQLKIDFDQQMTSDFSSMTLLEGDTHEIPLKFRGDVVFDVDCSSSVPDVVKATVANGTLKLECQKDGKATITVAGQSFEVTVLNADIGISPISGLTVPSGARSDYALQMKDNAAAKVLKLTGVSDSHDLSVRSNANCAKVTLKNGQLHVDPTKVGDGIYEIVNSINGEERVLLSLRVQIEFGHEMTSDFSNMTLLEGDAHEIPLKFRGDVAFDVDYSSTAPGVVKATVANGTLKLECQKDGKATITVAGQSFEVTVLNADIGISPISGLTVPSGARSDYALQMKDNAAAKVLKLTGVSDSHDLSVRSNANCAKVTLKNGQLHVDPTKVGDGIYEIVNSINGEERVLLSLRVQIEFGHEMTNQFNELMLLEGVLHPIELKFRENKAFDVECFSSDPSVVDVMVSNGTLTLECQKDGEATITVAGKSFKVKVARRVGLTGASWSERDGIYEIKLIEGETGSVRLSGTPAEYRIYAVTADGEREELHRDRAWSVPSGSVGDTEYTLQAVGKDFNVNLGTLKVTTVASVLKNDFRASYTIYAGQEYYIPLSASGSMPKVTTTIVDVKPTEASVTKSEFGQNFTIDVGQEYYTSLNVSGSMPKATSSSDYVKAELKVDQRKEKLYFTGTKAGKWLVNLTDGTNTYPFMVEVVEADDVLSGEKLSKNEHGHYDIMLIPSIEETLTVNLPSNLTYEGYSLTTAFNNICEIVETNNSLLLRPRLEIESGCYIDIYASHTGDMEMVDRKFVVATVNVTIRDIWMLSKDRINMVNMGSDEREEEFKKILIALYDLGLWEGRPNRVAVSIAETGSIPDEVWTAMKKALMSYPGFSNKLYYTHADIENLKGLGAVYKRMKDDRHANSIKVQEAAKKLRNAWATAFGRVDKEVFVIEQAAYGNDRLYLLDVDGYLITYDLRRGATEAVDAEFRYRLLAGNGNGVVAVDENNFIRAFGLDDDLAGALESIVTDVGQIAVTDKAVLLVLGPAGRYSISGNRDMTQTTLKEGQTLFVTADEALIAAGMGGRSAVASNVRMVAAGDSVLAFVGGSTPGMQKLYVHYENYGAPVEALSKSLKHGPTSQNYVFQNVARNIEGDTSYTNAKSIAVSEAAVAAVWKNGKVYMYGENGNGQLGIGSGKTDQIFRLVKTSDGKELTGVEQVVLLRDQSLFLDEYGRVWISGMYNGSMSNSARRMTELEGVKQLIRLDATRALGINGNGQICIVEDGYVLEDFFTVGNLR